MHGRASTAGLLLDRGADITATGTMIVNKGTKDERRIGGYTPLHFGCRSGEVAVVALLVERGAHIHSTDEVKSRRIMLLGHNETITKCIRHRDVVDVLRLIRSVNENLK